METPGATRWHENRRGALAMAVAMVFLTVNDALIKLVSEVLPAAQTIGVRGVFAMLFVLVVVLATRQAGQLRHAVERRTLTRGVLDVASTFTYLLALFHMPIAEATAINMAAPLMMVVMAVVFLGERVRWARWVAVLVGFGGMLLVVRPGGASFTAWAALCFAGTAVSAAREVYTRGIPRRVPSLIITFTTATAVALTGVAITTLRGWEAMAWSQLLLLAGASACLAIAYYLLVIAMRLGEVSVVGGFRYSALPAAALLGWVVWGHLPDAISGVGMVVLVGAGLFLLHHERVAATRATGAAA